jgi:hypothetical protein
MLKHAIKTGAPSTSLVLAYFSFMPSMTRAAPSIAGEIPAKRYVAINVPDVRNHGEAE